jgi:hypothetical protein
VITRSGTRPTILVRCATVHLPMPAARLAGVAVGCRNRVALPASRLSLRGGNPRMAVTRMRVMRVVVGGGGQSVRRRETVR